MLLVAVLVAVFFAAGAFLAAAVFLAAGAFFAAVVFLAAAGFAAVVAFLAAAGALAVLGLGSAAFLAPPASFTGPDGPVRGGDVSEVLNVRSDADEGGCVM